MRPVLLRFIRLQNYRNLRQEALSFHRRFNHITGQNGQGKTNLLEAIHMLCTARPFSQLRVGEVITFGESQGRIKGEFQTESGLNEVHITLTREGKTVRLNGKVVYDVSKIIRTFSVVTLLPQDSMIVTGPPSERRHYLDINIARFEPSHLRDLRQYARAISQRNSIIQKSPTLLSTVELWDQRISEIGARIIKRRLSLMETLEPLLQNIYSTISHQDAQITFQYKASIPIDHDIGKSLQGALAKNFELDRKRGHTTVGPHRDQPELLLNSRNTSTFASQGEAKTLAIALRAAEITLIKQTLGRVPIVLLDDISSELDERRRGYLFRLIEEFPGQIFVTSTSVKDISLSGPKKIFVIRDGRARVLTQKVED